MITPTQILRQYLANILPMPGDADSEEWYAIMVDALKITKQYESESNRRRKSTDFATPEAAEVYFLPL